MRAKAQLVDQGHDVDTLSLIDRISLRTNAVDWVLLVPNVSIEFDVRNTNWNRWAVGLTLRDNWQTSHTFKPGIVYNLAEARLDVRNYWRSRQIDDEDYPKHKKIWDKLMSCRRTRVKHPTTVWYRGLYASYSAFSFKFGPTGRQGNAITVGVTYGFIRPLYVFPNGSSLDLDMGISAGFGMVKADKYGHDRESNCYPVTEVGQWKFNPIPMLTEARVGFVYRLGKYPISKRYRWRYDVDMEYRDSVIVRRQRAEDARNHRIFTDSITREIYKDYWHEYDSIAKINATIRAKSRLRQASEVEAQRVAEQMRRKAENDSIKAAAKRERAEKKAAKKAAKAEAAKAEAETPKVETETPKAEAEEPKAEATKPEAEATKPEATTEEGKEAEQ